MKLCHYLWTSSNTKSDYKLSPDTVATLRFGSGVLRTMPKLDLGKVYHMVKTLVSNDR